jgi:hypothetical protein
MKDTAVVLAGCFFVLAANAVAASAPESASRALDGLRVIEVAQAKLNLGARLPEGSDLCKWHGRICKFKPGTFGGAEMMFLNKTGTGLIAQFHFYYGLIDFARMKEQVETYTHMLGRPADDATVGLGAYEIRDVHWSGSITSFDL